MFSEIRPNCGSYKHASFFQMTIRKQIVQACVLWTNNSRIYRNMKIARDDSAVNSAAVSYMAFHSTPRKGYQSKLLIVLSKGGRCNFWGLLNCDDRRSPSWARHAGPQHDTVMISTSFSKQLRQFGYIFIIPVLFCFVFEHETIYTTRALAVFDFYYP